MPYTVLGIQVAMVASQALQRITVSGAHRSTDSDHTVGEGFAGEAEAKGI